MSKTSDEFHKVSYTHHDQMATAHAAMMGRHAEGTPEDAFHKSAHHSHVTKRDYHKACMEKAVGDEMNKLQPTSVSAVNPGVRAVPRPGQQPVAKANVPTEFQHLFAVEEVQ